MRSGRRDARSSELPKGGGERGVVGARPFRGPALTALRCGEEQRSSPLARLGLELLGSTVDRGVSARPWPLLLGDAGRPASVLAIPELVMCGCSTAKYSTGLAGHMFRRGDPGDWADVPLALIESPIQRADAEVCCLGGEGGKLAIAHATPVLIR